MVGLNDAIYSDNLASTIRPFAPILADALGGSLRLSAISILCDALGLGDRPDETVLLTLLETNPRAIHKLYLAEQQFKTKHPRFTTPDIMAMMFIGIYVMCVVVHSSALAEVTNIVMVIVGYYFGSAFKRSS